LILPHAVWEKRLLGMDERGKEQEFAHVGPEARFDEGRAAVEKRLNEPLPLREGTQP